MAHWLRTLGMMLVTVLLSAGVAHAFVAVAMAMSSLNDAGLALQAKLQNDLADAIREKNWTKMMKLQHEHLEAIKALRGEFQKLDESIAGQLKEYEHSHGDSADTSTWGNAEDAVAAAKKYQELKDTRDAAAKVQANQLKTLEDSTRKFNVVLGTTRPQQMEHLSGSLLAHQRALAAQAQDVVTALQGLGAMRQAAMGPAQPIRCSNKAAKGTFIVQGVRLDPGQADVAIPLPSDRVVRIQGLAMTDNRALILSKRQNPTRNATVAPSQKKEWEFEFTVDTGGAGGTTTWRVQDETYEWNFPGNPKVPSTTSVASSGVWPTVKNDLFIWNVPLVNEGRFGKNWRESFWFAYHGRVAWDYARVGMGGVGSKKETKNESFDVSGLDCQVTAQ